MNRSASDASRRRSRSRPARRGRSGSPSVAREGRIRRRGTASAPRRRELAGTGQPAVPSAGGDCGGGARGSAPVASEHETAREREQGRERSSHAVTLSGRTREPGPSPGCRGCGAPEAPRARPELLRVRRSSGSGPVDHADVVLETFGRRVERVRRPSERRGHRPQRPSRHASRTARRRGTAHDGRHRSPGGAPAHASLLVRSERGVWTISRSPPSQVRGHLDIVPVIS